MEMSEKEYYNSQDNNSKCLHKVEISNLDLYIENHWSPYIEKELLAEIKSPIKTRQNSQNSELKSLCLLLIVLGLLSIGMCLQADSIVQSVREIARNLVEQTIQVNNR